jgi:hypothetical protein
MNEYLITWSDDSTSIMYGTCFGSIARRIWEDDNTTVKNIAFVKRLTRREFEDLMEEIRNNLE